MIPRAFGGSDLCGDRLVRLVFIDEAGISNEQHEPWLVVAGVIVDGDKVLLDVENSLDAIVESYIPVQHRRGFVLHATELFNGGKVLNRDDWPLEKRLEIAHEIASIPSAFNLPIAIGFIERAKVNKTLISRNYRPVVLAHVSAFIFCAAMVERWMRSNTSGEHCVMVVEDNSAARELLREQQAAFQNRQIAGLFVENNENMQQFFPFTKIKQAPLFEWKSERSVLQLADFCAYVVKRFLMNGADERYHPFHDLLRSQVVFVDGEQVRPLPA